MKSNILGCTISTVRIANDPQLFPILKQSTNQEKEINTIHESLIESKIESVKRHGKYFWLRLSKAGAYPGVLLMHFGMTGMIKIKNVKSHITFMENGGDKKVLEELGIIGDENGKKSKYFDKKKSSPSSSQDSSSVKTENDVQETSNEKNDWPPRFTKFEMQLTRNGKVYDIAFVDSRRFGKIRYLHGKQVETDEELLKQEPLRRLGPDYSKPPDIKPGTSVKGDADPDPHGRPRLGLENFNRLVLSKKKPLKSLLLDQEHFAGVGNWMSDEILFHARLHPTEIPAKKIAADRSGIHPAIRDLYEAIIYVCEYSVLVEGNVKDFPSDWLMLYRWGKGRKKSGRLKTEAGYDVDFVTVGGRTSCFVPQLQKLLTGDKYKDTKASTKRRKVESD